METELDWINETAGCLQPGVDPAIFFPEEEDRKSVNAARKICMRCPLKDQCRDYAVRHREDGVWGATTAYERRRLRRHWRLSA